MKRCTLIGLAILLITLTAYAGPELRVMTFNIRWNNPDDGENAWPHRKELAASMIRYHNADIVGCQEALMGQISDLETLLPDYGWFGVGREDGIAGGEFSVVFYKKDRLAVVKDSTFWLSETPQQPVLGWDAACKRVVTMAKLKDKENGHSFYLFNTHFDHMGETARLESAKLIISSVAKIANNQPVIVTGDFNCNPGSAPYEMMVSKGPAGLKDSKLISKYPHHGPDGTWTGFTSAWYPDGNAPIDYIFVSSGIKVIRHATLSDCINGKFPSDHMPVLTEIILPTTGQD